MELWIKEKESTVFYARCFFHNKFTRISPLCGKNQCLLLIVVVNSLITSAKRTSDANLFSIFSKE